jgi:hypothetical protein
MIDTAGTLCAAAQTVLDEGAARVIACATHGVFSGSAYERLAYENSKIDQIVVTDTLPLRPGAPDNITVLSTAGTFADSIRRIFTDDSVSEIFAGENQLFLGLCRRTLQRPAPRLPQGRRSDRARQHARRAFGRGRGWVDTIEFDVPGCATRTCRWSSGRRWSSPMTGTTPSGARRWPLSRGARRLPRAAPRPG